MSAAAVWTDWLERYVDDLVARGHIRTERVARAFRRVPRHRYIAAYRSGGQWIEVPQDADAAIPVDVLAHVYSDAAPVTALHEDVPVRTATAPPVMAEMLEALELEGGERVLEIGTGTGYNAALLAEITGAEVVTIERSAEVAEAAEASLQRLGEDGVTVVAADGFGGHAADGPYDRVIATVAAPGAAEPWMDQLALDGIVVAPVEVAGCHPVVRIERGRPFRAAGRGVWWTDVVAGGGALAHQTRPVRPTALPEAHDHLEHPGADQLGLAMPEPRMDRPGPGAARTVRSFLPPLDAAALGGLCAYVTVADRRATTGDPDSVDPDSVDPETRTGACVVHGRSGAVAVVGRTGIFVDGPDEFAEEVGQLADRWRRAGSPGFDEWTCQLTLERRPAGRFWRAHEWSIAGLPLPPEGRRRGRTSRPASLSEGVLAWLADTVVEACTSGLRSVARRPVVDLVREVPSSGCEPADLGVRRAFAAVADAVEEMDDIAPGGATIPVRATVDAVGAPRWAATIASHVVAHLIRSPTDRPLCLAGPVLRIAGQSLEVELERRQVGRPVRALLATDTFREDLRSSLTDGLRVEVRRFLSRMPTVQHIPWERFIAPDQVRNPVHQSTPPIRPAPAGARPSPGRGIARRQ